MKRVWHQSAGMSKIYFSTIAHSDAWTSWGTASYYFPFASRLAQIKYGWNILNTYVALRLWLEKLRGKL